MPLIVEVAYEEVSPGEFRFTTYDPKRGSQETVLRISRETGQLKIKPMQTDLLEHVMLHVLLDRTFSDVFQEALCEFAEGFFLAGIEHAKRQKK